MMDDIAEQQDVAREISDAISNPVAFGQVILPNLFYIMFYFYFLRTQNSHLNGNLRIYLEIIFGFRCDLK